MTQHLNPQDTQADTQTMRRLAWVIGAFIVATAVMATTIGIII